MQTLRLIYVCAILCLLSLVVTTQVIAQATFELISDPIATWSNFALNKNGTVMAANYGGEIFRWTAADGFVDLGMGDFLNSSIGISADGTTIIAGRVGSDGATNPAIWRQDTGWVDLGHPANGCSLDNSWGSGYGISYNGGVAVGLAWYCPGADGFRWTKDSGMIALSHPDRASSRASAISADASTIVGFYEDPRFGNRRPVRWKAGKTDLFAGEDAIGEATAVSSDGSQIAGQYVDSSNYGRPFYYTDAGGIVPLGQLTTRATDQGTANAVSDSGVVVGFSGDPFSAPTQAFMWSSKTGMRWMKSALVRNGATVPDGVFLYNALTMSADGSTIVGLWFDNNFNQGSWIARLHGKNASWK